ncbi:MAG: 1-acyl-sn-glycerol-3-phosphate acyltransferase [Bacteroidetes bacterium]|nr:1-acyl-sn-glycerol-3-phosphate acyltransferase [Bacteroidota bacterium]
MKILQYGYVVWALLVFVVFMLLFLPFFLLPPLFGQGGLRITYFFLRLWSWIFSKLNFIPYAIEGRENLTASKSFIVVSNHTSFLDLPGICLALPGQFRPLAKTELKKIPVFGWIASTATIMVDRSNPKSRRKSMNDLLETLARGISVLIFAEGTQNRTSAMLQPFKDGAFKLAIDTGASILPVVISGAGRLMPPGRFFIKPGKIHIRIGAPIAIDAQLARIDALKQETFNKMSAMLLQLQNPPLAAV